MTINSPIRARLRDILNSKPAATGTRNQKEDQHDQQERPSGTNDNN